MIKQKLEKIQDFVDSWEPEAKAAILAMVLDDMIESLEESSELVLCEIEESLDDFLVMIGAD